MVIQAPSFAPSTSITWSVLTPKLVGRRCAGEAGGRLRRCFCGSPRFSVQITTTKKSHYFLGALIEAGRICSSLTPELAINSNNGASRNAGIRFALPLTGSCVLEQHSECFLRDTTAIAAWQPRFRILRRQFRTAWSVVAKRQQEEVGG